MPASYARVGAQGRGPAPAPAPAPAQGRAQAQAGPSAIAPAPAIAPPPPAPGPPGAGLGIAAPAGPGAQRRPGVPSGASAAAPGPATGAGTGAGAGADDTPASRRRQGGVFSSASAGAGAQQQQVRWSTVQAPPQQAPPQQAPPQQQQQAQRLSQQEQQRRSQQEQQRLSQVSSSHAQHRLSRPSLDAGSSSSHSHSYGVHGAPVTYAPSAGNRQSLSFAASSAGESSGYGYPQSNAHGYGGAQGYTPLPAPASRASAVAGTGASTQQTPTQRVVPTLAYSYADAPGQAGSPAGSPMFSPAPTFSPAQSPSLGGGSSSGKSGSGSGKSGSGSGSGSSTGGRGLGLGLGGRRAFADSHLARSREAAQKRFSGSGSGYSHSASDLSHRSPSSSGHSGKIFAITPVPASGPVKLEPEDDDYLHDPRRKDTRGCVMSSRGMLNVTTLLLLVLALLMLFAGYPLLSGLDILHQKHPLMGTNGTGQIPDLPLPSLVDIETPASAQTWTSPDKIAYNLVFSDEFNTDGRTFWPGDDPYWEAVDIWYGATGDYEWYSPENLVTGNGSLQITFEAKETHNLNFQSGMLQSWNKTCFQGGYVEFAIQLPGTAQQQGYWPGAWLMGNLARPGYLGSSDGMWPYSYSACDVGILPNQTNLDGTGPAAALDSTAPYAPKSGHISKLPGMRASSCTCPGQDHPGPNRQTARSAPEIDILEASVGPRGAPTKGTASQSMQIAPFDENYGWAQTQKSTPLIGDSTRYNSYTGGAYQEAVSALSDVPLDGYTANGQRFVKYAVEYEPDWNLDGSGYVRWFVDGAVTWEVYPTAFGPSKAMQISQRHVSPEPMSLVINLGMSGGFEPPDFDTIDFPGIMKVDYVRVYQRAGRDAKVGCDPPDYPSAQYITDHQELYTNPNVTRYTDRYTWPTNQLTDPGC